MKNSVRYQVSRVMMKNGFSLVELLIYMGLLTVFLAVVTRIFTAITDVQLSSEATGSVEEDGRYIYTRLAYDIGRATGVVTPASLGEQSGSLTVLIDGVANTYSLSGNNLILANIQGANQVNSINTAITDISFRRLGNEDGKDSIRVSYTISSTTQQVSGADEKSIVTTIALR